MLKENWRSISRIERVCDNFIVVIAFLAAYYGRASLLFWDSFFAWQLPFEGPVLAPLKDYFFILVIALISYNFFLNFLGAYDSMRLATPLQLLWRFFITSLFVLLILSATLFILKINLSRSFIMLFCFLCAILLTAERMTVLSLLRYWRRKGMNYRNIIICGVGAQALRLAEEILSRPELGIRIRGFSDLKEAAADLESNENPLKLLEKSSGRAPFSRRIIKGLDALKNSIKDYAIDEIIFTDIVEVMPEVEEMIIVCSEQGIRTTIAADLFSVGLVKSGMSYFGGMPLIHFQTPPGDRWELSVKRLVDISVSLLLLVVFAPLFFILALGVRITSPGPVIFKQKRVGLNGRLFNLYKFRSMVENAEQELEKLLPYNEMSGPVFKMKNDPRVTRFGKFLRKFSLDELPQFWNVLVGDMSLVGPRPPVPGEVSLYERKDRRRLSMRPGLTCTWQVSGRNKIEDFESWVKLDLEYIDNWSLGQDFILLFRTIPAVLFGSGAR